MQFILHRKDYAFHAIEAQDVYQKSIQDWKSIENQFGKLKWILINSPPLWDHQVGQFSLEEFNKVMQKTRDYAVGLQVAKVHLVLYDAQDNSQV